jgi:hypothetical protein
MRRRRRDFATRGKGNSFEAGEGDINPNAYLTNLADCMLVMSVGFMVALVAAYNVNLSQVSQVQTQDMTEVDNVQKMAQNMTSSGSAYDKLGEVYKDPTTGKMYMVQSTSKSKSSKSSSSSKSSGSSKTK